MKIRHRLLNTEIDLDDQRLNKLIIENPDELVNYIAQLDNALYNADSDIYFTNSGLIVKAPKFELIKSVIGIDFNNKRIQNALLKRIHQELLFCCEHELSEKYGEIYAILDGLIKSFAGEIVLNDAADIMQIIKLFCPSYESVYDSTLERIIAYINICIDLFDIKYLAILHAQEFLNKEGVYELYKHCAYKDVGLLLIESRQRYRYADEFCLIIDDDLCEITPQ